MRPDASRRSVCRLLALLLLAVLRGAGRADPHWTSRPHLRRKRPNRPVKIPAVDDPRYEDPVLSSPIAVPAHFRGRQPSEEHAVVADA